jgi:hypothetical protein
MAIHRSDAHLLGPGFTRIAVTGFKSLATKTDLEIRPLTVLAGANSSGKSSLMQPLLLMKQTLESDVNPAGPFLLSGPYARYTQARQFLSHPYLTKTKQSSLAFEFSFDEGMTAGMLYSAGAETGLVIEESWGSRSTEESQWRITTRSTPDELRAMLLKFSSIPLMMDQVGLTVLSAVNSRFYQGVLYSTPADEGSRGPAMERRELYYMQENLALNSHIRKMIYVPGLRGDQNRKWLFTDISEHGFFEGPFESYVPTLIYSWQHAGDAEREDELEAGLELLGLASGITTIRVSESEVEVLVPMALKSRGPKVTGPERREMTELSFELPKEQSQKGESILSSAMKQFGTKDRSEALFNIAVQYSYVNIADVGLAVSTVLPVLVALIQANPGQLVYIEQPELHLHPRAQWKLAQLLADAANRGVRLVIETHSSLLLSGILTQIAKGKISDDKVVLHWFMRDPATGLSTVESAHPDSMGRVGEWPEDFADVELIASNEYLDAVEAKLMASRK